MRCLRSNNIILYCTLSQFQDPGHGYFTDLSTEIMTSCQVLEAEETVPHACTTTARILMNHLSTAHRDNLLYITA